MVQFTKLKIHGFKSFVDKTELDIGAGLNGVVGPNGCGKSNLVEALRWVMGETSAKRMRGDGMDDVIFNGTKNRPARNLAEVTLTLDNTDRKAPAAYNQADSLEITRKIERDKGSSYRINGKLVRARDVQMLFADTVTGANSPALVSQGRITEIIKAKPNERRLILEDSAGISGLFVRRHEAELKLKATSNNLQRIEDVFSGLEDQLAKLEKQVKQAEKYRDLSHKIRQADIIITLIEAENLTTQMATIKQSYKESDQAVAKHMNAVSIANKQWLSQSENLPKLRKTEAEAAARLQHAKVNLQRLEDEQKHQQQMRESLNKQLARLVDDIANETQSQQDLNTLLEKLAYETADVTQKLSANEAQLETANDQTKDLSGTLDAAQSRHTQSLKSIAEYNARKASLSNQIMQNEKRLENAQQRYQSCQEKLEASAENSDLQQEHDDLQAQKSQHEADIETTQGAIKMREAELITLNETYKNAQDIAQSCKAQHDKLTTEINVMEGILSSLTQDSQNGDALIDHIKIPAGFEKALSRGLGESLMGSLDTNSAKAWHDVAHAHDLPPLPRPARALSDIVTDAPPYVQLALSQIGVVDDADQATAIWPQLQAGQCLVTQDGALWRWDGYKTSAEASDSNAERLEYKNKIQSLTQQLSPLAAQLDNAEQDVSTAKQACADMQQSIATDQEALQNLQRALSEVEKNISTCLQQKARFDAEQNHLKESLSSAEDDIKTIQDIITWDQGRLKDLQSEENTLDDEALASIETALKDAQDKYSDHKGFIERLKLEQTTLSARARALADEKILANNRNIRCTERLKTLNEEQRSLQDELNAAKDLPVLDHEKQQELLALITQAELDRTQAADTLIEAEKQSYQAQKDLKETEAQLSNAREVRAVKQAEYANAQENFKALQISISERFSKSLDQLKASTPLPEGATLHTEKVAKDQYIQARNRLGAVNLRAQEEYQDLKTQYETMATERTDLIKAVDELQSGINTINKEARIRLEKAFEQVNQHFQKLFTLLFEGGNAHLALVGSSDPLDAGLEIFAQPPGKSLQSLSLLSGGEQTMASIALIFAMFLTTPSPICVLDEIDAPLDDANVDRVCNLLEDILNKTETRFIIITHHRLTMARMNRLYGVTMQERGVSQLVSVDMQQHFDFIEAA